jgi:hypothetical protein
MNVHTPVYHADDLKFDCSFWLLLIPIEILTKLRVRSENNILAVLSFKSSDGKVAARDRLKVVDKCIVDGSTSDRADDGDGLRGRLLRNDQSEPRGDLCDQAHEHWATFLNDASLSDEAGSFRDGRREDPAYDEIAALRFIVSRCPTAEPKDRYA